MRYVVFLGLEALEELVRLRTVSRSRESITLASKALLQELEIDPRERGTHLSEGLYYYDAVPLRGYFVVDDEHGEVEITDVWQI